jgi:beta-glucosidase
MEKPVYLDNDFTVEERAKDLVSRMTLEEKASQLRYDAPAIKGLGIPRYNWWNEGLHGVARAGIATVFPQAIALAAIFDDQYLKEIADIISTEARAKYNESVRKNDRDIYKGLTLWSPNVNIFRDPRWGRGQETYGEDPYLTSRLGVAFVEGLQGTGKYLKVAACAKHFAVHSGPEALRHEFNAIASKKDMYETYLPAFEACVKEAKVESVMGAYNRTNGEPCSGSKTLLKDILKDKWGFQGHIVSDCWAIRDFHTKHMVTKTAPESAALALKNGCDVNCGNTYLHLLEALQEGLITEEDITTATEHLMRTRIKLGMFDSDCEYDKIPYEQNDCKAHNTKSLDAARKSMVLLKNDGLLPLDSPKLNSIAVIGPNADNQMVLKGNYYGTASKYTTLLEGIQAAVGETVRVYYAEGCHMFKDRVESLAGADDRSSESVSVAERADVVILCLGLDSLLEGEEGDTGNSHAAGDKANLNLPGLQQRLLEKVVAVGKPTILLLSTGSALAINWAQEHCNAIINTWYPGSHGGEALADLLFGKYSPSGKLPITFYQSADELPDFEDYNMKGRTYRYMTPKALYPFGFGLTYGHCYVTDAKITNKKLNPEEDISVEITLKNDGTCSTEDVVQLYIHDMQSEFAVPNSSLCGFSRVHLDAGEQKSIVCSVKPSAFLVVDQEGNRLRDSSFFKLFVGTGQPDERSFELTGLQPVELDIRF